MRVLVAIGACVAAIVVGCGDDESSTTESDSGNLVSYERTGGVASMPERMTIEAGGSGIVEAGVDPAREAFELGSDELEQLRSELEAADFEGFEQRSEPTGCADCYVYEVTYDGTTVSYDQSETIPEPMTAAVAHLSEIAAAHYPADAGTPPIVN